MPQRACFCIDDRMKRRMWSKESPSSGSNLFSMSWNYSLRDGEKRMAGFVLWQDMQNEVVMMNLAGHN